MRKFTIIALSAFLATSSAYASPESNMSIEEFRSHFSGKVLIKDTPLWKEGKNVASAIYLAEDGSNFQCNFAKMKNQRSAKHLSLEKHPKFAKWKLTKQAFGSDVLFTTNGNQTRSIIQYDANENILKRWYKNKGKWTLNQVGHLQKSWPAWALEECPTLELPSDLPINQKQTTFDYNENYEVIMGKLFPVLLNNSLTKVEAPVLSDDVSNTPDAIITKLKETGGFMLPVSEGKWATFNPEWNSIWISSNSKTVDRIGNIFTRGDSTFINWLDTDQIEEFSIEDTLELTKTPSSQKHLLREVTEWILANNISSNPAITITHKPDGTVHRTQDNITSVRAWEMRGETYIFYGLDGDPREFNYLELLKKFSKNPWTGK